ncbi:class I adenylate-forming enzyme family protein [Piscinibacter sakaiensis]|uniref:class I adenylate-forming enzyme family protein n=1 Tax=Piscinibacter sakaiensis TaxID=1547922 RepID=UPI003AAC7993
METTQLPEFGLISDTLRQSAAARPGQAALICGGNRLGYAALDQAVDRVAASLQRDGLRAGDSIAVCATASIDYATVFLGALRAGVVVAPLAPGSTAASLARMVSDADARLIFVDAGTAGDFAADAGRPRIALDDAVAAGAAESTLQQWLIADAAAQPAPVEVGSDSPFNIIYSSGTTGEPKGIVQPHGMRWSHVRRGVAYGYGPDTIALLATPLYSNTTLVVFFPALAYGGTVVLMPKFDAADYLKLAEKLRVTHTMLVPVQYQRLMARPDFDRHDLSSFRMKFSTSAPFGAALKADVLRRWPGGLTEFYGMTEGGGTCILEAHRHPDKLHTVGRPAEGHDIRLIDEAGREVGPGEAGEVVGHSSGMMTGYHRQPEKTRDAEWFAPDGKRFIRTGDVGRFDADGFLTLFDRRKDMIISGGFNIYPSDLEAQLRQHPSVADAAVVGVPSEQWGETPVAYVVLAADATDTADSLKDWFNQQVGKTQRLADLRLIDELPRSAIGKVLKRELRLSYRETPAGKG